MNAAHHRPESAAAGSPRPFWTGGLAIVLSLALGDFLVHLLVAGRYGYSRDELYYLICARHLAWGYAGQPPLIAFIARLSAAYFGTSLRAIRLLPAAAGAATVLLAGLLAGELRGRAFAQALAALAVFLAPGFLGVDSQLTMNAFAPLFWTGCAALLARLLRTGDTRLWLLYGLVAGLGLEIRHSMACFGLGTVVALLLAGRGRLMHSRWFWLGALLALLLFAPNLIWEFRHGFPAFEQLRRARAGAGAWSLAFLDRQVLLVNPFALLLAAAGLIWCFLPAGKPYRPLAWLLVSVAASLAALGLLGRGFGLLPAYPILFAAGGVAVERLSATRGRPWLRPACVVALALSGLVLAPAFLPVLPVEMYLRYSCALHLAPAPLAGGPAALPENYAEMFGWREMAASVARIYDDIPPGMRSNTVIFCANYGEASALTFFGPRYGLPDPVSPHLSFYEWGPGSGTTFSVIAVGFDRQELERTFYWVEQVAVLSTPHAMPSENGPIFYCRGKKVPFRNLWAQWRNRE